MIITTHITPTEFYDFIFPHIKKIQCFLPQEETIHQFTVNYSAVKIRTAQKKSSHFV